MCLSVLLQMLLQLPRLPLQTCYTPLHPHLFSLVSELRFCCHWEVWTGNEQTAMFWIPRSACSPLNIHSARNGPNGEQLRASFLQGDCWKIKLCQGWQLRAQHSTEERGLRILPIQWNFGSNNNIENLALISSTKSALSWGRYPSPCFRPYNSPFWSFLHIVLILLEDTEDLEIIEVISGLC